MRRCPNCGALIADDSRFCAECGKEVTQGNVCPHCGASVGEGDAFCQNCGKSLNENPSNEPITYEEEQSKSGFKKYLPYIIGAIILVAICGGGWFVYNKYIDTTAAKNAKEQAVGDSIQQKDNKREDNYTDLWLNVWGNIGDSSMAELQFEKGAGWYVMSQNAPVDSRRILKVKSYDKKSGRLVFNAYYKGEYIGILDGIFQSDKVEVEPGFYNVIQSYSGKFKSVKGVDIVFSFHGD